MDPDEEAALAAVIIATFTEQETLSRTLTFKKIFVKLKFSPALFEKIPSFVCLVFKMENK